MSKTSKNKNLKKSLIALLVIIILGGTFYFKEAIYSFFDSSRDYSNILIPAKQSDNGDFGFVNSEGELVIDFDLDLDSGETVGIMYNNIAFYYDNQSNNIVYVDNELNQTPTEYVKVNFFMTVWHFSS